ncbi:MAG: glycogen debranching N-terminal domain-containing protein [Candidatus Melainabacteria bacterium]|nr:glycogen debranching N-terminal domain-containing protein [Candidatus Melainabacteria bacterium]
MTQQTDMESAQPAQPQSDFLPPYEVDMRPLCQGMPFVMTDAAHPRNAVKHGSHFLVLDESGLIPSCNTLGYGYYRYDTRHLSSMELTLNGGSLSVLSSDFTKGYAAELLYTNNHSDMAAQQKITVARKIVMTDVLWEQITLENFDFAPLQVDLAVRYQSDFADIFEVRGTNRPKRGQRMLPTNDNSTIFLAYLGLDTVLLETVIEFKNMVPTKISDGEAFFRLTLPVRQPVTIEIYISTRWNQKTPRLVANGETYKEAETIADNSYSTWRADMTTIETDLNMFNVAIENCYRDLYMLRQPTPKGLGIAAGIPWYCALFGRDTAITALQLLPFAPELARGCIDVLAAYQGEKTDTFRAERAGKILHELRVGEMARLNEIPHSPYYGTVDATQLWLILLAEYIDWTGDMEYAHQMWPNVKLALRFLEQSTRGGYISYKRESSLGLENQGWKDSGDSVTHANGILAEPPIALCEAQGYLYAAWIRTARLAQMLGYNPLAIKLQHRARNLKERFQSDFWMIEENFVAIALDKDGQQVKTVSSNPGHCLWSEILNAEQAKIVADRLMAPDNFSGWGIRTLSSEACSYNPISYHNGSVWPHDNGIICEGLRKIGRTKDILTVLTAMYDAMRRQSDFRLPELFCGFERANSPQPIDYPVSCRPQAWAAGAIFQMLRACVNLAPDASNRRLRIVDPVLPMWLSQLRIYGLKLGNAQVDIALRREGDSTYCTVLRKQGDIRVVVET